MASIKSMLSNFATAWGVALKSYATADAGIRQRVRDALAFPADSILAALGIIAATLTLPTARAAGVAPDAAKRAMVRSALRMVRDVLAEEARAASKAAGPGGAFVVYALESRSGTVTATATPTRNPTVAEAAAQKAAREAAQGDGEAARAALIEQGADALADEVLALRAKVAALTAERDALAAEVAALKGAKGRKVGGKVGGKAAAKVAA